MRKVIANFKMHQTPTETKDYLLQLLAKIDGTKNEVVLCFPATSLTTAKYMVANTNVKLGGQNIADDDHAKTTGEISGDYF